MARTFREVPHWNRQRVKYYPHEIDPRDELYHGYDDSGSGKSCTQKSLNYGWKETTSPSGKKSDKKYVSKQSRRQYIEDIDNEMEMDY